MTIQTLIRIKIFLIFLFLWIPSLANAVSINFEISGLNSLSSPAQLAIEFIDGDGLSNNAEITKIITDGGIDNVTLIGGANPITGGYKIIDSDFYNSVALLFSNSTSMSFVLNTSNNSPIIGGFPDTIAIYLLDQLGLPLNLTDEPLGTNALMAWTATGNAKGQLDLFSPIDQTGIAWVATYGEDTNGTVPEPGVLSLLLFGVLGIFRKIKIQSGV